MIRNLGTRVLVACAMVAASVGALAPAADAAVDPCGTGGNLIACENSLPGTARSAWDVPDGGSDSLVGFATSMSVAVGAQVDFKVKSSATYKMDIYRTGWYGGDGARKVGSVTSPTAPNQPACLSDAATGLVDCGNWSVTGSWAVPADAVSGVYVAVMEIPTTGARNHIIFVVRDDNSHSPVVFQTADTTWQAYNVYGGNSLYTGSPAGRAYKVSYNRPFKNRSGVESRDFYFGAEYAMVQFLERNGIDVSYVSGIDVHQSAARITGHATYLSVGHDEYWSGPQRTNVETARDAGVNLAFFAGNEVYWRTRFEPSIDASGSADRTMVCYKETKSNAKIDPSSQWTGTWRDARFPSAIGSGNPENALTGTRYQSNTGQFAIKVPGQYANLRLWRDTSVATLAPDQTETLAPNTLGYEFDEAPADAQRPAGLVSLSRTTESIDQYLVDYGSTVLPSTATHEMTLYRAPSGALVFGAGTIQWSFGLGGEFDGSTGVTSKTMQQATLNLLADMGASPATPVSGLVVPTKGVDTTAPLATVSNVGTTTGVGSQTTVTGTATDAGGVVAGVEVSVDGGATWRPAIGGANWTYTMDTQGIRTLSVKARAIDDSGNIGPATPGQTATSTCPCTMLGDTTPAVLGSYDPSARTGLEVGVRFTPSTDGWVSALRFYRGPGQTGTQVGRLYGPGGVLLGQGSFTGTDSKGWQEVSLSTPVQVLASQEYVSSVQFSATYYPVTSGAFSGGAIVRTPLTAKGGVYRYGPGGIMPTSTYQGENYFADVKFTTIPPAPDTTAPKVVSAVPAPSAANVSSTANVAITYDESLADGASITATAGGTPVAGTTTLDQSRRVLTFTPTTGYPLGATVEVTVAGVKDNSGNLAAIAPWTFTVNAVEAYNLFGASVPAILADSDTSAVELGTQFKADQVGFITGFRFYKGSGNGGTHVGRLYGPSGSLLAEVSFTAESADGWQQVGLPSAVAITANTTYTVGVHHPQGHYAASPSFFAAPYVNGHLTATQGVYKYGAGGTVPTSSYQNTNYWVDATYSLTDPGASPSPSPTTSTVSPSPTPTDTASPTPVSPSPTPSDTATASPSPSPTSASPSPTSASPSPTLAAPTGLTATANGAGITLDWDDSPTPVSGYNVYRAAAATGPFTKINPTPVTASTWDDMLAPAGTSYYQVTAVTTVESAASAAVSVAITGANRIANPGFELDANADGRPDSWTSSARFTAVKTQLRSGVTAGQHDSTSNQNFTISSAVMTGLTAGTTYRFGGWVNIPTTTDAFTFVVRIAWRNSSNAAISSTTVATYSTGTAGWTKLAGNYPAPTGATRAVISMVNTSLKNSIYVDDFSLR